MTLEDLVESSVHVYNGSRTNENDAIVQRYPSRPIDYVLFQTGTFNVPNMNESPPKTIGWDRGSDSNDHQGHGPEDNISVYYANGD